MQSSKRSTWIKGFEGIYKIFADGTVISFKQNKITGKPLAHKSSGTIGYKSVDLMKDGKHEYCYIHKLLAQAFIKNPHPRKYDLVIHKDGNIFNNALSNLIWTDIEGKSKYQYTNRRKNWKKNKMFSSILSNSDVDTIAKIVVNNNNKNLAALPELFNISSMSFNRLRNSSFFKKKIFQLEKLNSN